MGWARTIWKFNKGLVEKEGLMFLKGRGGGDTPKHTLTRTTKKGHKVGVVVIVVLYFP